MLLSVTHCSLNMATPLTPQELDSALSANLDKMIKVAWRFEDDDPSQVRETVGRLRLDGQVFELHLGASGYGTRAITLPNPGVHYLSVRCTQSAARGPGTLPLPRGPLPLPTTEALTPARPTTAPTITEAQTPARPAQLAPTAPNTTSAMEARLVNIERMLSERDVHARVTPDPDAASAIQTRLALAVLQRLESPVETDPLTIHQGLQGSNQRIWKLAPGLALFKNTDNRFAIFSAPHMLYTEGPSGTMHRTPDAAARWTTMLTRSKGFFGLRTAGAKKSPRPKPPRPRQLSERRWNSSRWKNRTSKICCGPSKDQTRDQFRRQKKAGDPSSTQESV